MNDPPSSDPAMVRMGPLMGLASVVRSFGCDPELLFRAEGFSLAEFSDPDHRVPFVPMSRLLARCVAATSCHHLGLLLGQRAGPSHLGIAGFHDPAGFGTALGFIKKLVGAEVLVIPDAYRQRHFVHQPWRPCAAGRP